MHELALQNGAKPKQKRTQGARGLQMCYRIPRFCARNAQWQPTRVSTLNVR